MIKVTSPRGNQKVFAELASIEEGTRKAIRQAWFALGKDLERQARAEARRRPKSGRTYVIRIRGRIRRHRASAPGESHANITRELIDSVGWKVHGTDSMVFGYGITSGAPRWAPFVEMGTRNMDARPTLENAIDAIQGTAEERWQEAMFREFNS